MKRKNQIYRFNKKNTKLDIPSTIEKYPNNYSKIFCELLNVNLDKINNETNGNISLKRIKNRNILKIGKNKKNEKLINKQKLNKLKYDINSTKNEHKIRSYENFNENIKQQKITQKPEILEKSSSLINNISIKKSEFLSQNYSEVYLTENNNSNIYFTSLNNKINNILLSNNLLKIQKSFNSNIMKKEQNTNCKTNYNKINHIEVIKGQSIKKPTNTYNNINQIEKNKKINNKLSEMNKIIDTKIIYGHIKNNKKETLIKDKTFYNENIIHISKIKTHNNKKLNNKSNSSIFGENNIDIKKIKKYYLNSGKKLILKNNTNTSPFSKKVKLLKIKSKANDIFNINNKTNINLSKIPSCNNNRNQIFLKNPIKTESINIDLHSKSNNHQKIFKYYSDKKTQNNLILYNKNNITTRNEDHNEKDYPLKINHSYRTIYVSEKKARSLSKKREEKKKLNLIKLNRIKNQEDEEEIKLNNILKSLENQKNILNLKKNIQYYSEPKKLIDKIRKYIKIKKILV